METVLIKKFNFVDDDGELCLIEYGADVVKAGMSDRKQIVLFIRGTCDLLPASVLCNSRVFAWSFEKKRYEATFCTHQDLVKEPPAFVDAVLKKIVDEGFLEVSKEDEELDQLDKELREHLEDAAVDADSAVEEEDDDDSEHKHYGLDDEYDEEDSSYSSDSSFDLQRGFLPPTPPPVAPVAAAALTVLDLTADESAAPAPASPTYAPASPAYRPTSPSYTPASPSYEPPPEIRRGRRAYETPEQKRLFVERMNEARRKKKEERERTGEPHPLTKRAMEKKNSNQWNEERRRLRRERDKARRQRQKEEQQRGEMERRQADVRRRQEEEGRRRAEEIQRRQEAEQRRQDVERRHREQLRQRQEGRSFVELSFEALLRPPQVHHPEEEEDPGLMRAVRESLAEFEAAEERRHKLDEEERAAMLRFQERKEEAKKEIEEKKRKLPDEGLLRELNKRLKGESTGAKKLECRICTQETDRLMAFLPCGHRCVCTGCKAQVQVKTKGLCIICRAPFTQLVTIFDA